MAGVFNFDEDDDIEPFPSKSAFRNRSHVSKPVKNAEEKSCSTACRKHERRKIGKNVDKKINTKGSCQSLETVLKASRCSSSQGSTMTQLLESSSKAEVIEQPVKIQGCCFEISSVSPYAKENFSEVTVGGEDLLFAEGMIQMHSLEFTFMADSIALRLLDNQNSTTIAWPLDDITGFSFRTCEQTSDNMLELNLTESGMKLLEQKLCCLLCKSDFSCDKDKTLTTRIKGPYQSDQERKITSLCDHYKFLWRPGKIKRHDQTSFKEDLQELKGDEKLEGNMATWFDLTYPKGDPDAVLVTMDDFLLLNPNEFVSDTIIDFYIKYLQSQLPKHEKEKLHFFNSFFFRKLAYLDRDIAYELEKTSSLFERMKRWTRDINIFTKDFLFIPIMQSAHWSLVIVCYPNLLFNNEHQQCYKETLILHFDSMEGFHKGVEETIEKYLVQHWDHTFASDTSRNDKSCNVKCLRAKVPQQTNYSDCGPFMLHYVEMFLAALKSGLPKIHVSRKWFNPEDVASKRGMLQRLIRNIQEEETAGRAVQKHAESVHGSVFTDNFPVALKKDLCEEVCFETAVQSSQQVDHSCHLWTIDHASSEPVCCQVAHAVGGNQLCKASDACLRGGDMETFDEESSKETSNILLMENKHTTFMSTGKDGRQLINICGDFNVSREELNRTCEVGLVTNANQEKSIVVDEVQVSFHTVEMSLEGDEEDDGYYNLTYCDQNAAQGSRLKRIPCKEQQTLLQANNHGVSGDLDFKDHHTFTGASSRTTHLKHNLVDKMDHTQDDEQQHSPRAGLRHVHSPTCQSHQVDISSSDEESGFVKVQKRVEASKVRQQRKAGCSEGGVPTQSASNSSKGKENQLRNAKWRLRRKSQFHFL